MCTFRVHQSGYNIVKNTSRHQKTPAIDQTNPTATTPLLLRSSSTRVVKKLLLERDFFFFFLLFFVVELGQKAKIMQRAFLFTVFQDSQTKKC